MKYSSEIDSLFKKYGKPSIAGDEEQENTYNKLSTVVALSAVGCWLLAKIGRSQSILLTDRKQSANCFS